MAIGARVRQVRQSRRWTLDQLAEVAGVSRRMVVNVEQGAANPSVGTLLRISDALGVGLPALVEPPQPKPVKVTRRGEGAVLWSGEAGGRGVLVAGTEPPDVVELWDWTLGPGDAHAERGPRGGDEGARAGPAGQHHGRGRGPVGDPRGGRRGLVPRRRGALVRQSQHAAGEVLPGCLRAGCGRGVPVGGPRWVRSAGWMSSSQAASSRPNVFALRPDYRAMLVAVDGLVPRPQRRRERHAAPGGGGRRP